MQLLLSIQLMYIDPGTASQIVAVVSGIIISGAITLGVMRTKIVMFFQKQKIARMEKRIMKENAQNQPEAEQN